MRERLYVLAFALLLVFPSLGQAYDLDLHGVFPGIGGDIALAEGEHKRDDIIRIGESIEVAEGDTVAGDVVSIGGSVTVRGHVSGDAVSVGGSIVLEAPGVIEGDAVSVGGGIEKGEGTRIGGSTAEIGMKFGPFRYMFPRGIARGAPRFCTILGASPIARVIGVGVLLLIAVLLVLFLPGPTGRLSKTVQSHLPRSILFGILGEIAIVPLCLVLAVSVIGIPLIPLALIAYAAAFLLGMAGVGLVVGEIFLKRAGATPGSSVAAVVIGVVLIELLALLGTFLSPVTPGLGGALRFIGVLVLYFAWTIGLGAVIVTRFGTRQWVPKTIKPSAQVSEEKGGGNEV